MTDSTRPPVAGPGARPRKRREDSRARLKRRLARLDVIHEDDACILRYAPGTTNRVVVAFCGIRGALGPLTHRQIARAGNASGRSHVIYVLDKKKSWYSAPGLAETIMTVINDEIDHIKAEFAPSGACDVVSLGSSMGGFGALLFAGRLGASRAVSFVPQYAMDMSLVPDARIGKFLRNIYSRNIEALGPRLTGAVDAFVVCGSQDGDLRHLEAFPASCGLRRWVVNHPRQGVLEFLDDAAVLTDAINALLIGDKAAADAVFQPFLVPDYRLAGAA